jgi:pimeloyl-ACP methyl ester carboxylesterase
VAPNAAVVFVANGAGDSRAASKSLAEAVMATRTPLQINSFAWSLGSKRVIADQVDQDNHQAQGRRLAEELAAYRQAFPQRRICVLGQSAGNAVVLRAAELLPPNSIDRAILLSPSVSAGYDLRPPLQACREGIDLFHSHKDRWILGMGMRVVGTTDGASRQAAGRVGFKPLVETAADAALYARLRQHAWDASVKWSGHDGGHFGNLEPRFLSAYVLPLLVSGCPANAAAPSAGCADRTIHRSGLE